MEAKEPHYPEWIREIVVPGQVHDDAALLHLAVEAARNGMKRAEGGPFGAIIATREGKVVSVGTNLVVSGNDATAHAEILAIRRAGQALGTFRLRGSGVPALKLLTTCEPCLMCVGAIHWAGVPEVIAAARKEDAERYGFIEGPAGFDPASFLEERGILYRRDFLRTEALQLFQAYEGELYNG